MMYKFIQTYTQLKMNVSNYIVFIASGKIGTSNNSRIVRRVFVTV